MKPDYCSRPDVESSMTPLGPVPRLGLMDTTDLHEDDLETRDPQQRIRVSPTDAELVALHASGELLSAIFGGFRLGGDDRDQLKDRLATLHNSGTIDLLAMPLGQLAELGTQDYFSGHALLYQIIPKLEGNVAAVMRLVNAMVERAGNDGAANIPNGAYRTWAASQQGRAQEGLALEAAGNPDAVKLLRFNLEAGPFVDTAIAMVEDPASLRRLSAGFALGHMNLDTNQASAAISAMGRALATYPADDLKATILHSAIAIGERRHMLDAPEVLDLIAAALVDAGPAVHYNAAQALFPNGKDFPASLVAMLLAALQGTDRSHKGTIDTLDTALQLLLDGHAGLAIDFVESFVTTPGREVSLTVFDGFGSHLLQLPGDKFATVFVRWMLSDKAELGTGLSKILRRADRDQPLDLPATALPDSEIEQVMLCRRACAYLFLQPVLAASVLTSVLRTANPAVSKYVVKLLFDPLVINYGGSVRDYLDTIVKTDIAYKPVRGVIRRVEAFIRDLRKVGAVNELHPSEHHRQIELQRHADSMRRAFKEAEKASVLLSLVSRSTILHGRAARSYFNDLHDGGDRSMTTEMHSHGYSFELPRMEVIDPVGLSMQLFLLRTGKPAA